MLLTMDGESAEMRTEEGWPEVVVVGFVSFSPRVFPDILNTFLSTGGADRTEIRFLL